MSLPASIRDFKDVPAPNVVHPRVHWDQFEAFFASHGFTLWKAREGAVMVPPDDRIRAPDGFHYWLDKGYYSEAPFKPQFMYPSAIACPARTSDGRDVVLRVVSVGDEGANHRAALQRLSTGNIASVIGNHSVPVLQWLELEHVTFAVLPFLSVSDPTNVYSYEDVGDVLKTMIQMLEAVSFCHSQLVAHLDLFEGNFLCNYRGGMGAELTMLHEPGQRAPPFRSLYPFLIYLIDFDTAVCFDNSTPPAARLITGLPPSIKDEDYCRPRCPEMITGEPYCPFLADVWQLGTTFENLRLDLSVLPLAAQRLIDRMTAEKPRDRPSSAEALQELREIMAGMSLSELRAYVPI